MRLMTSENPANPATQALKRAFDILAEELGIADSKEVAKLRLLDGPIRDKKGVAFGRTCMHPDTDEAYQIEIDRTVGGLRFLFTLCHEMVHLKQVVKRELYWSGHTKADATLHWQGQALPLWQAQKLMRNRSRAEYENSPGEPEAFARQDQLFTTVWAKLSPEDRAQFTHSPGSERMFRETP